MKKLFFTACLSCMIGTAFATNPDEPKTMYQEFKGLKASEKGENPCKGLALLTCGTVTKTFTSMDANNTFVETVTEDCDGNVVYTNSEIQPYPLSYAIEHGFDVVFGTPGPIEGPDGDDDNGND